MNKKTVSLLALAAVAVTGLTATFALTRGWSNFSIAPTKTMALSYNDKSINTIRNEGNKYDYSTRYTAGGLEINLQSGAYTDWEFGLTAWEFPANKDHGFEMKIDIIELLGDILNVYGKVGDAQVIVKMPNKYGLKVGMTIKVAIETDYARFFNQTTTKAILEGDNQYEEIEVTQSLDNDNVSIIKPEKKGFFRRKK